MENEQIIEIPKRRGRIPKGLKSTIEKKIIECNKTLQHPTQQNVADETGVCRQTVANVLAKYGINKEELEEYRDNQADILLGIGKRISENITEEDVKKAPMRDKLVGLGIVIDKFRLITGQSTSNIASWTKVVTDSHVVDKSKTVDI